MICSTISIKNNLTALGPTPYGSSLYNGQGFWLYSLGGIGIIEYNASIKTFSNKFNPSRARKGNNICGKVWAIYSQIAIVTNICQMINIITSKRANSIFISSSHLKNIIPLCREGNFYYGIDRGSIYIVGSILGFR
ncbi:MAG: hypothetical protein EBU30_01330 [Synechococcaceae bacterium WB6_3B_236]|nr:hypothetical protein [Synechococcaceae bacterium WB6_3B_236]